MNCIQAGSRALLVLGLVGGCGGPTKDEPESTSEQPAPTCKTLFGLPSKNTGLTAEQCSPHCADCDGNGTYSAAEYSSTDLEELRALALTNPSQLMVESPYATPEDFPEQPEKVCALTFESSTSYRLDTFENAGEARAAGGVITHEGACGACSSLQDLAVYIETPDLTTPVRQCGLTHLGGDVDDLTGCISDLGFSEECARIWAHNSVNTREVCLEECLAAIDSPYHLEDGSPNACIQCDEDNSGPVFKAVSGRTRRNSGLPTALCRPCAGIARIEHRYAPP